MTIKGLCLILIASWLGAAIFFSGVVAPAAFSVLRAFQVPDTSEIAGAIVSRSLSVVNVSGFFIGLVVLVITLLIRSRFDRWVLIAQAISLSIMVLMCALGQWVIAARMRALRTALSLPIDQIALDDPSRVAFAVLHRYSVIALAIAMIAALIGSILLTRTGPGN